MGDFNSAVRYVLGKEGTIISIDPNDPGGITKMGISFRLLKNLDKETLSKCGIYGEITEETIEDLTLDQAKTIYQVVFWSKSFEQVQNQDLCNFVFDMAVNEGIAPAIKSLQRASWSTFGCKKSLVDDGILGDETLKIINSEQNQYSLLCALRSERAGNYRTIAAIYPNEEPELEGWLNRAYVR